MIASREKNEYLPSDLLEPTWDKASREPHDQAIPHKRLQRQGRIMRSWTKFVRWTTIRAVNNGLSTKDYDLSYDDSNMKKGSILTDRRLCKMVVECQSVKVKEFQERCNIKAFQEWYEHVGPEVASPQDGKVIRWRRDCAWLMISRCSRSQCQIQVQGTSSIQEVNDHYNIFTRESQEYELKTKDKA
ncbi:hypothetical protein Tco_0940903 [Tanacetum coccineum]|uniref:Uncharacterized protein n=1 Tax=Tanacetum coccineum TaxID=301880 RepID=A0ABQ5DRW0_9ASTR